jgi:hypothetical protein
MLEREDQESCRASTAKLHHQTIYNMHLLLQQHQELEINKKQCPHWTLCLLDNSTNNQNIRRSLHSSGDNNSKKDAMKPSVWKHSFSEPTSTLHTQAVLSRRKLEPPETAHGREKRQLLSQSWSLARRRQP